MGRLSTALAASLMVIGTTMAAASVALASAEPNIQPAGSMPIPEGRPRHGSSPTSTPVRCSPAAICTATSTGQHHQDPAGSHRLDELGLDATVVASPANARVECNCAGIKAGHTYTVRQLLDGILLVSGNDAANTLADMLGATTSRSTR